MKRLILLALAFAFGLPALALARTNIDVVASMPAGRYDHPIYVTLTASDPAAKVWYTCKRNGTPSDLFRYEKPILLEKSCALIYFGYVTTEIESKIERSDYTIFYSEAVKLETKEDILSLRNTGESTVDIGGWEVIAGTGAITVPAGTNLPPKELYTIGKVPPDSYSLKSPEGLIKHEVAVAAPVPKPKTPSKPTNPPTAKPAVVLAMDPGDPVAKPLPIADEPLPSSSLPAASPENETPVPNGTATPPILESVTAKPAETPKSQTQSAKASALETATGGINLMFVLIAVGLVILASVLVRFTPIMQKATMASPKKGKRK